MTLAHPTIKDGWFTEVSDESFPGQAFRLRVRQILEVKQSPFQDVLVFESTNYGNVLVLDGIIQATERDEFAYQEMITHLACNSHASPKRVLVIGGGDGGVLREIVKHECVQEAILVEIDETVIRLAKKHLTKMAVGFSHPKVKVVITDGFQYLKENQGQFDVIITDSSDPDGPANSLFGKEYFQLLYNALTPNGVVSTQASENVWLNLSLLKQLKSSLSEVFPNVRYAQAILPTYTSGQLGLMIASRNKSIDLSTPLRTWDPFKERELNRYYSKEIHSASFVVPQFAKKSLA